MKKLDTFTGPGEIKSWEACWTLVKKLDTFAGPGKIKRWVGVLDSREEIRHFRRSRRDQEVVGELDPQVSSEEIKSREVELDSESWTSFASVV